MNDFDPEGQADTKVCTFVDLRSAGVVVCVFLRVPSLSKLKCCRAHDPHVPDISQVPPTQKVRKLPHSVFRWKSWQGHARPAQLDLQVEAIIPISWPEPLDEPKHHRFRGVLHPERSPPIQHGQSAGSRCRERLRIAAIQR